MRCCIKAGSLICEAHAETRTQRLSVENGGGRDSFGTWVIGRQYSIAFTSMVVAPDEVAPADGRWWAFTLLVSRLAELPHGALATIRQHKKEKP